MSPTLDTIDVSKLHFDAQNPRLPERVDGRDVQAVTNFFLLECNLAELMMSIAEQGYFHGEPLLVVPHGQEDAFVVVEGNRRLASLKILSGEIAPRVMEKVVAKILEEAKERPSKVPCLIFSRREEILNYLGYRHITGIKEWDALAKARYLTQLRMRIAAQSNDEAHRILAKEIGSKANAVAKILTGYHLLKYADEQQILKELKLEVDDIAFSLLTTAIGWTNIASFIGLEGSGDVELAGIKRQETADLFRWMFFKIDGYKTLLVESRNLQILNRIVAHPDALRALRNGASLEEADVLAEGPLQAVRINISNAITATEYAQQSVSSVDSLTSGDLEEATKLRRLATALEGSIKNLLSSQDD